MVTFRRGLDLISISLEAKVLSLTCIAPHSEQVRTRDLGFLLVCKEDLQLWQSCWKALRFQTAAFLPSLSFSLDGRHHLLLLKGTASLKQKGQLQPAASLFSGKYFGGGSSL